MELDKSLAIQWVPNIDHRVTSSTDKRSVIRMEIESVDWVNLFDAVDLHAVGFKGVILSLIGLVQILYGNSSFNRTDDEELSSRLDFDSPHLILK